jgi:hypothetical protein
MLAAFALAVPAGALAGGSAGNQQYTDPFAGSTGATQTKTQAAATAPATTAPATTAPAATPPPATTSPDTATTGPPTTGPSTTDPSTTDPTTTADATATTLPYTGYADWAAGALGAGLIALGLTLRLRTRDER